MKCEGCGEEWLLGHICIKNAGVIDEESVVRYLERQPPNVNESLENLVFVLRDILEELKKFNEREQRKVEE
jgi:hypothetical protein